MFRVVGGFYFEAREFSFLPNIIILLVVAVNKCYFKSTPIIYLIWLKLATELNHLTFLFVDIFCVLIHSKINKRGTFNQSMMGL